MHARPARLAASTLLTVGLVAASALRVAPVYARAPLRLGLGGAIVRSTGQFSWVDATGYGFHVSVAVPLRSARVTPRVDLSYTRLPRGATGHVPEAPDTDHRGIRSAAVELEVDPLPDARFSPYLVGGVGVARVAVERYFVPSEPFYDRANATVLCAGAGARWRLGVVSAYAEAQYQRLRVGSRDPEFETAVDDGSFVPIALGITVGGGAR